MTLSSTPEFDSPNDELLWILRERFTNQPITSSTTTEIKAVVHAWADRHGFDLPPFEVLLDGQNEFVVVKKTGD